MPAAPRAGPEGPPHAGPHCQRGAPSGAAGPPSAAMSPSGLPALTTPHEGLQGCPCQPPQESGMWP